MTLYIPTQEANVAVASPSTLKRLTAGNQLRIGFLEPYVKRVRLLELLIKKGQLTTTDPERRRIQFIRQTTEWPRGHNRTYTVTVTAQFDYRLFARLLDGALGELTPLTADGMPAESPRPTKRQPTPPAASTEPPAVAPFELEWSPRRQRVMSGEEVALGKIQAIRGLGFSLQEIAIALRVSEGVVKRWNTNLGAGQEYAKTDFEGLNSAIEGLLAILGELSDRGLTEPEIKTWWGTPNPQLGNRTPRALFHDGRYTQITQTASRVSVGPGAT